MNPISLFIYTMASIGCFLVSIFGAGVHLLPNKYTRGNDDIGAKFLCAAALFLIARCLLEIAFK